MSYTINAEKLTEIMNRDLSQDILSVIESLMNDDLLCKGYYDSFKKYTKPNCLGTSLYAHQLIESKRPEFVPKCFDKNFNSHLFDNIRKPGSIVYIRNTKDENHFHSGIILAETEEDGVFFMQRGFGGKSKFCPYKQKFLKNTEMTYEFYYPKKEKINEIKSAVKESQLEYRSLKI